jgi:putative FmdB family regulatory protein
LQGMPTYKYRCPNGDEFEAIHGMDAAPPTACEVCGAAPVTTVFYPIAVSFTGPGFYATDYGQGEQKPEATSPTGESVKAPDKAATKTAAKTTKKSELESMQRHPSSMLPLALL